MDNLYRMLAEVEKRAPLRHDWKTSSTSLNFVAKYMSFNTGYGMFSGEDVTGVLSDNAFRQVAEMLDAPPLSWLNDPKSCDSSLLTHILNYLAKQRPETEYFVRQWGEDTYRAVLSSQYSPFDHDLLLPMVIDAFEQMGSPEHKVVRGWVDHHMRGYILFPELLLDDNHRDPRDPRNTPLHPAMYFTNEETGRGGLRILPAVFTGFCQNGSIFGLREQGTEQLIRHRWYDTNTLREKVAIMIGDAMHAADEVIQAYVSAYTVGIGKTELKSIIADWTSRSVYHMGKEDAVIWENNVLQEAGVRSSQITWGDLINGLTVMSHGVEDTLQQQRIEGMSGDILTSLFRIKLETVETDTTNGYRQAALNV